MALPSDTSVKTLKGAFFQNKELSDSQDGILSLQGVPYPIRQIARYAKIRLEVVVEPAPAAEQVPEQTNRLKITMTTGLSGLGFLGEAPLKAVGLSTTKSDVRFLDGTDFTQEEPVVGKFVGKMWICTIPELEAEELDDFLKAGWDRGNAEDHVIRMSVKSVKAGDPNPWAGEHVWGIQSSGEGATEGFRYTGRVEVSKGPEEKKRTEHARLVYDYAD